MGRIVILQGRKTPHEIVDLKEALNFYELTTNEERIDRMAKNVRDEEMRLMLTELYNNREKLKSLKSMLKIPFDVVIINQLPDDMLFYP